MRCRGKGDSHLPNNDSAPRLIGALLTEQNEIWQECCYLDMDEFAQWVTERVIIR
ncbi:hypothetical protein NNRS527_00325 [Nitrosospira sp. NRS527]|nr:hypothetical protein NNRS527_00325 [Nitrosospira sp. NRS527]